MVWGSGANFHFSCPNPNRLLAQNRRQRKNHTSKLQELALLLPMALKKGTKKLTKVWGPREGRRMREADLKISVTSLASLMLGPLDRPFQGRRPRWGISVIP